MAVVIMAMVAIVLTALGVLGVVYAMHLVAQSPRVRGELRRRAFVVAAGVYSVRRQLGSRLRKAVAPTDHRADSTGAGANGRVRSALVRADQRARLAAATSYHRVRPVARRTVAVARRRVATGGRRSLGRGSVDVGYAPMNRVPVRPSPHR